MLNRLPPDGTIGITFSNRSTITSIKATTFFSTASLSAASNSSFVVTLYPIPPKLLIVLQSLVVQINLSHYGAYHKKVFATDGPYQESYYLK